MIDDVMMMMIVHTVGYIQRTFHIILYLKTFECFSSRVSVILYT